VAGFPLLSAKSSICWSSGSRSSGCPAPHGKSSSMPRATLDGRCPLLRWMPPKRHQANLANRSECNSSTECIHCLPVRPFRSSVKAADRSQFARVLRPWNDRSGAWPLGRAPAFQQNDAANLMLMTGRVAPWPSSLTLGCGLLERFRDRIISRLTEVSDVHGSRQRTNALQPSAEVARCLRPAFRQGETS